MYPAPVQHHDDTPSAARTRRPARQSERLISYGSHGSQTESSSSSVLIITDPPKTKPRLEDENEAILWKGRKVTPNPWKKSGAVVNGASSIRAERTSQVVKHFAQLEVQAKQSSKTVSKATTSTTTSKPAEALISLEPSYKEVYDRRQAAIRRQERFLGPNTPSPPEDDDYASDADWQLEGKQRKMLDARVHSWLSTVPAAGFFDGQRKLTDEGTREWLKMAKRLNDVKLNEEIRGAGSWVGDRFYPDGFW